MAWAGRTDYLSSAIHAIPHRRAAARRRAALLCLRLGFLWARRPDAHLSPGVLRLSAAAGYRARASYPDARHAALRRRADPALDPLAGTARRNLRRGGGEDRPAPSGELLPGRRPADHRRPGRHRRPRPVAGGSLADRSGAKHHRAGDPGPLSRVCECGGLDPPAGVPEPRRGDQPDPAGRGAAGVFGGGDNGGSGRRRACARGAPLRASS